MGFDKQEKVVELGLAEHISPVMPESGGGGAGGMPPFESGKDNKPPPPIFQNRDLLRISRPIMYTAELNDTHTLGFVRAILFSNFTVCRRYRVTLK